MAFPINNLTRIWVRGRFVDIVKAAREDTSYGLAGPVQFIPQIDVALDAGTKQILGMGSFSASPSPTDGYFAINLPATNDPDVNPTDWKYKVVEPTGREYLITVPYDTPVLSSVGDPLNGQRVLELANVVPDPDDPTGTVQLLVGQTGRGIASAAINGSGHLILTYDDEAGTTVDTGAVTGVLSLNGSSGNVTITKSTVGLGNVDNTADTAKPVSTAQSTAISTAVSNHVAAADPHTQYLLKAGPTAFNAVAVTAMENGRIAGIKTTSGSPTGGSNSGWAVNDLVFNRSTLKWMVCTAVTTTTSTWSSQA